MTFGSLFSGIGGFDLGFERAGMTCAWQVENEPSCQILLQRNFPETEKFTDVKDYGRHHLTSVDLICGGFPCTDVSIAGRRKGLAGEQSGLWFEMLRILAELCPPWVVIENVPGLFSSHEGRDFAVLLSGLVECGYRVAWRVLDAQGFGLAQRRKRVFLVGHLGDGRAAEVLFEPQSLSGDSATCQKAGNDTARVAGTFAANGGGLNRPAGDANELDFCIPVLDNQDGGHVSLGHTAPLRSNSGGSVPIIAQDKSFCLNAKQENRYNADETFVAYGNTGYGQYKQCEKGETLRSYNGGDQGGGSETIGVQMNFIRQTQFHHKVGTLQAQPGYAQVNGLFSPKSGVRRLTPTECERLMGFPDGWTADFSDSIRYRMLGNAVSVPVAHWLGTRINRRTDGH